MIEKCIQQIIEESVVAERLIRALKNKTYKNMTSVSKNAHIDKLVEIL